MLALIRPCHDDLRHHVRRRVERPSKFVRNRGAKSIVAVRSVLKPNIVVFNGQPPIKGVVRFVDHRWYISGMPRGCERRESRAAPQRRLFRYLACQVFRLTHLGAEDFPSQILDVQSVRRQPLFGTAWIWDRNWERLGLRWLVVESVAIARRLTVPRRPAFKASKPHYSPRPSRLSSVFTQADIARAVRASENVAPGNFRVRVTRDGEIIVEPASPVECTA
jgi:hypothetical protein